MRELARNLRHFQIDLLVNWNLFQKLVLIQIVHHVDLLVVVWRQNTVKHSIHERLLSLVTVAGDAF
jgi:hypothetical protein